MKEKKTNPVGPVIVVLVVSMLLGLIWSNSNRKNKTARVKVPVPAIEITKGEPKGLEIKVPFGPKIENLLNSTETVPVLKVPVQSPK
ncbi:MAG: hypothetical protein Ta2B_04400 [Termitinemataceae bacterium]|nr:MAG: hypothetical protein Ta2B_04400 [Termitinemataceae bacterium]